LQVIALLLHGEAGGWDELLIALVAFGVLWIAVKLAGRKPAEEGDDEDPVADPPAVDAEEGPAHPPPAAKLG
jgi:hypothetical protein